MNSFNSLKINIAKLKMTAQWFLKVLLSWDKIV